MRAYYAAFIPDDGKLSVLFPDVSGCQTWGETMEEAFERAIDALDGHLEAMACDGDTIPEPSTYAEAGERLKDTARSFGMVLPKTTVMQLVPAPDLDSASVRVTMSMRKHTLEMIDRKAEAAGMTRSGFIANAARAYEHI